VYADHSERMACKRAQRATLGMHPGG
jgi:hypothetical protein